MDSSWPEIIDRLSQDKLLKAKFTTIYTDGISIENIQDAIIQFEHSLATLNSPFDRWLQVTRRHSLMFSYKATVFLNPMAA